jgi:hypothetical protein
VPAKSEKQRKLAGADLARLRAGKKTVTGMTEAQLREFARKNPKGNPHGRAQKVGSMKRVMRVKVVKRR